LPSPIATISTVRPPPADALTQASAAAGGGVDPGVHLYALTDVTSSGGETLPGPTFAVTVGSFPTPPNKPTPTGYTGGENFYNDVVPGWHVGAVVGFFATFGSSNDPNAQSAASASSDPYTLKANPNNGAMYWPPVMAIIGSADPNVKKITLWGFLVSNPSIAYLCETIVNAGAAGGNTNVATGAATTPTWPGAHPALGQIALNIPGPFPAGVSQRKLYRTAAGGAQLKFVQVVAASGVYTDTLADAGLGANAPTVNTATAAQVAVSGIPTGIAAVTGRKMYRTAAGAAQLQLLATLADNTTTTYTDAAADSALGANLPPGDTSGIQQPNGQVLPGSPTLPVAGLGAFVAAGGWAIIGNGQQVIRYTGIAGGSLTGIPPAGPGAIVAAVSYNSTATAAPAVRGIPATGSGRIRYPIASGDPVDLLIIVDDVDAQTLLASLIGGSGIKESKITDRRIGVAEATARGNALLAQRKTIDVALNYTVRDPNTVSGATVHVDLPAPHNVAGDYQIQDVMLSAFSAIAGRLPTATVQASTARYTFDDLLRISRSAVGVDPNGTGN
jgi:hypothetical protein